MAHWFVGMVAMMDIGEISAHFPAVMQTVSTVIAKQGCVTNVWKGMIFFLMSNGCGRVGPVLMGFLGNVVHSHAMVAALTCVIKLMEHVHANQTIPAQNVKPVSQESTEDFVKQIAP